MKSTSNSEKDDATFPRSQVRILLGLLIFTIPGLRQTLLPDSPTQLKSVHEVRVHQKEIRDPSNMHRKDVRKLGHSYSVKFIRDGK
jgi:hypothetical protein